MGQVPEGFEVVRLTNEQMIHSRPNINNASEVVWSASNPPNISNIFQFADGWIRQVTNETWYDLRPVNNDTGSITWLRGPNWEIPFDVIVDDGSGASPIPGAPTAISSVDINDSGHVVLTHNFRDDSPMPMEIFLYDGNEVRQISNNGLSNQSPRINNFDWITWTSKDLDASPSTRKVMLYRQGQVIDLTDGTGERGVPDVNDLGQVVWGSGMFGIELWENGKITTITPDGRVPRVNNLGYISFARWDDELEKWDVILYRDGKFLRLPAEGLWGTDSDINDRGEVSFRVFDDRTGYTDIFLMRRIAPKGDFDHDCHVDLRDFRIMQLCFTGPDAGPPGGLLGPCQRADFDDDKDVDYDDFAAFFATVTGPGETLPDCQP